MTDGSSPVYYYNREQSPSFDEDDTVEEPLSEENQKYLHRFPHSLTGMDSLPAPAPAAMLIPQSPQSWGKLTKMRFSLPTYLYDIKEEDSGVEEDDEDEQNNLTHENENVDITPMDIGDDYSEYNENSDSDDDNK